MVVSGRHHCPNQECFLSTAADPNAILVSARSRSLSDFQVWTAHAAGPFVWTPLLMAPQSRTEQSQRTLTFLLLVHGQSFKTTPCALQPLSTAVMAGLALTDTNSFFFLPAGAALVP